MSRVLGCFEASIQRKSCLYHK